MTTGSSTTPPPFDTERATARLRDGGFTADQAIAIARTLVDATRHLATRTDLEKLRLATKADLEQLRLATKADFAAVRASIDELKTAHGGMKETIGQMQETNNRMQDAIDRLQAEIVRSHASTVRMMIWMTLTIIGSIAALLRWVLPQ